MIVDHKTVWFRCDASLSMGGGHIMRCLTLADVMTQSGWACGFITRTETLDVMPLLAESGYETLDVNQTPDHADLLIVDHYDLDETYETPCRSWANKIAIIDDMADRAHDCDILLDQTYGRGASDYKDLVPEYCRILTGTNYALLRPQFLNSRENSLARRIKGAGEIEYVLVSAGSTNIHNITLKMLEGLEAVTSRQLDVSVVMRETSYAFDEVKQKIEAMNATSDGHNVTMLMNVTDMASLMAQSDLAIGAGGTTSWERCALGLPTIMLEIADNQALIADQLNQIGAVFNLGWHETVQAGDIQKAITDYIMHPEQVLRMSAIAADLCDGNGTQHFIDELEGLSDHGRITETASD